MCSARPNLHDLRPSSHVTLLRLHLFFVSHTLLRVLQHVGKRLYFLVELQRQHVIYLSNARKPSLPNAFIFLGSARILAASLTNKTNIYPSHMSPFIWITLDITSGSFYSWQRRIAWLYHTVPKYSTSRNIAIIFVQHHFYVNMNITLQLRLISINEIHVTAVDRLLRC